MSEEQKLEWYQESPAIPCKRCGCYAVPYLHFRTDSRSSIPSPYYIWTCCQEWGEEDLSILLSQRLINMERKTLPMLYQVLAIKELTNLIKELDAERIIRSV